MPWLLTVAAASLLPGAAAAALLRSTERVLCEHPQREEAARLLAGRHWRLLDGHPCVPRETLALMEAGVEDPEDAGEFLGRRYAPILAGGASGKRALLQWSKAETTSSTCTKNMLPSLVYIGIGHSGSTTLADALDRHPDLSYGDGKEHNFLWHYDGAFKRRFLEKYRSQFSVDCGTKVAFDSSPRVVFLGDKADREMNDSRVAHAFGLGVGAVRAMQDLLGNSTKFILMFRDPVPWAMSNGVQPALRRSELVKEWSVNISNLGFGSHFVRGQTLLQGFFAKRACYANALAPWLEVFPRENFLFLDSDDFFRDPQSTLDKVCDFAGVPRREFSPEDVSASGRRRNSRKATAQVHRRYHATAWARDCRQRLEKMTGLRFRWTEEDPTEAEEARQDSGAAAL